MTALAQDRVSPRRSGQRRRFPVAAGVVIFHQSLVVLDSSGYARPGRVSTTDKAVGCSGSYVDNTNGAAGAQFVDVERSIFRFENSTSGDLIALTDINADCYVVDDQTVAKTNGSNTRIKAGTIFDVDASGVWVAFA